MEIISRKEAKARGLKRYFTGKPCKHGHVAERLANHGSCVVCNREYVKHWKRENPERARRIAKRSDEKCAERVKSYTKKYYKKNRDKIIARVRDWRAENPDKFREQGARRRAKDPEGVSAYHRDYYLKNADVAKERTRRWERNNPERVKINARRWRKNNPAKKNAEGAARRARRRRATPSWLTDAHHAEMLSFYQNASLASEWTGIAHDVDHIYPLRGETCSGLHVPWNLRVVTAKENRMKHNKLPVDSAPRAIVQI